MTLLDQDPIETRLRNALRRIAEEDLADRVVTPLRPPASSRRRTWVRPATIAAALVVLAGLVALGLALRDDEDDTSVVVDEGDSGPVYVIPGPPLDTVVPSSHNTQGLGARLGQLPRGVSYWGREEGGRVTTVIELRPRAGDLSVGSLGSLQSVNESPPIWRASTGSGSPLYFADVGACGRAAAVSHRADQADVVALLEALRCENDELVVGGRLPDGLRAVPADVVHGTVRRTVVLPAEGGSPATFVIVEGQARLAPFLTVLPADAVESLTIGGRDVQRAFVQGHTVYRWVEGGASVALALSGPAFDVEELESIIGGARRVTETEWQAWLGVRQPGATPGPTSAPTSPEPGGPPRRVFDLPSGVTPVVVSEATGAEMAAQVGNHVWGKYENGRITSALFVFGLHDLPPEDSLSTRRVLDIGGRRAWARPGFPGTEYVVDTAACGVVSASAHRVPEPDALALLALLSCDEHGFHIGAGAPHGYGPLDADVVFGERRTMLVLSEPDGRVYGRATLIARSVRTVPFLIEADLDQIEQLDVGGEVVHRVVIDGRTIYRWGTESEILLEASLGLDELAAFVRSTRVVSEDEWQQWIGETMVGSDSDSAESEDSVTVETTPPAR